MVAQRPWDANYNVSDTIWVAAHTTQFTARGWLYLGGDACALLDGGGGSFVSLVSPDKQDLTVIIETVGANATQTISLRLAGVLAVSTKLHVFTTAEGAVFQQQSDLVVHNGLVTVSVPPNNVWTLSTTTGQKKGMGSPIPKQTPFPMPYVDTFEGYPEDTLAKYFSDVRTCYFACTVTRLQSCNAAPVGCVCMLHLHALGFPCNMPSFTRSCYFCFCFGMDRNSSMVHTLCTLLRTAIRCCASRQATSGRWQRTVEVPTHIAQGLVTPAGSIIR